MTPDQITQLLDQLGQRLGPTGQHAFELAVRYTITNAAIGFLFGLLLLVATAIFWIVVRRNRERLHDGYDFEPVTFVGAIGSIFTILFGVWFTFANLVDLLNPEYTAIRNLLESVAGK